MLPVHLKVHPKLSKVLQNLPALAFLFSEERLQECHTTNVEDK